MWILCIVLAIVLWIPFHIKFGGKSCNKKPAWLWILMAALSLPMVGCEPSYYRTLLAQDIDTNNAWDCPSCFWDNEDWNWKGYEECYMINGREIIFGCWHEELGTKDVRGWDKWYGKPPHPSWMDDNERNEKNPDGSYKFAEKGMGFGWMPVEERLLDVYKQYVRVYPDPNYPDDAARRRVEQQDKVMDLTSVYMERENRDDLTISDPYGSPHFFFYPRKFSRDPKEYGPFGSDNDSMYYSGNWYDKNWYFMRKDAAQCGWVNGNHYLSGCWHDERDFCPDPYGYDFPFKDEYLNCPDSTLAWDEWPGDPPETGWLGRNKKNTRNNDGSLMYPNGVLGTFSELLMPTIKPRTTNRANHAATEW